MFTRLTCLHAISPHHLVLGGHNGGLWVCREAGGDWTPASLELPGDRERADVHIQGLAAAGERLFAAGTGGVVLRSDDGGRAWSFVATGAPGDAWFEAIHADARGLVLLAGSDWGRHAGLLLRSRDGGRTWSARHGELHWKDLAVAAPDALYLRADDSVYVLRGDLDADPVRVLEPPEDLFGAFYTAMAVPEPGRLVAVGAGRLGFASKIHRGFLHEVTEGGARITAIPLDVHADWIAIATPSPTTWILLATDGTLARSVDGGRTWRRGDLPPYPATRRCAALHARGPAVFAIGEEALYRSDDAGETWAEVQREEIQLGRVVETSWGAQLSLGGRVFQRAGDGAAWSPLAGLAHARALVEPAPGVLVALGDGIQRSDDRGATWSRVHATGKAPLRALTSPARDVAVAVGDRGQILRTADGGRTWRAVAAPLRKNLNAVWSDGPRVIAVGAAGTILRSDDGGQRFEVALDPSRLPALVAVAGAGSGALVALARARPLLLRSTDRGRTWTLHDGCFPGWVRGLVALPDGRLAVGDDHGQVYLSSDGLAWSPVETGVSEVILALSPLAGGGLLALTQAGLLVPVTLPRAAAATGRRPPRRRL